MQDFFPAWLCDMLQSLAENGAVPAPSRFLLSTWIRGSWEMITDDAIPGATKAASFPDGVKVSQLVDTEYFQSAPAHASASESECDPAPIANLKGSTLTST